MKRTIILISLMLLLCSSAAVALDYYRVQPNPVENDKAVTNMGIVVYNPTAQDVTISSVVDTWSIDKVIKNGDVTGCSPACTEDQNTETVTFTGTHVIPAYNYSIFKYSIQPDGVPNGNFGDVTFSNNVSQFTFENVEFINHAASAYLTLSTDGGSTFSEAEEVGSLTNQTFTMKIEETANDRELSVGQYVIMELPLEWNSVGTTDGDVTVDGNTVTYPIQAPIQNGNEQFTFYAKAPLDRGSWLFNSTLNGTDEDGATHNDAFELLTVTQGLPEINISTCPITLIVAGNYKLINDLNPSGDCISINGDDISFDGQGYKITGDGVGSDDAIIVNGQNRVSVKNLFIDNFGGVGVNGFTSGNPLKFRNNYENLVITNSDNGMALYTNRENTVNNVTITNMTGQGFIDSVTLEGNVYSNIHVTNTSSNGIFFNTFGGTMGVTLTNSTVKNGAGIGIFIQDPFGASTVSMSNVSSYNNGGDGIDSDTGPLNFEDVFVYDNGGKQFDDRTAANEVITMLYSTPPGHTVTHSSATAGDRDITFNLSTTPYGSGTDYVSLNESADYFSYFNQTSDIDFATGSPGGYVILTRNDVNCFPSSPLPCDKILVTSNNQVFNVTSWSNYTFMNITREVITDIVNNSVYLSNIQDLESDLTVNYEFLDIVNVTTDLQSVFVDTNASSPYFNQIDVDLESYPDGEHWINFQIAGTTGYPDDLLNINYTFNTLEIFIGLCNATLNHTILNISYFDEVSELPISVDNGMSLTIDDGSGTQVVSESYINETNSTLCSNLDPALGAFNWNSYGTFTLEKDDYVTRVYSISEEDPLVLSNDPVTNLELFMIPINDSTTVRYNWQTTNFGAIDGIMKVYRCNLDGSEDLIESASIISSGATANIQLFTQTYRYEVVIGGVVYTDPAGWSSCHVESLDELRFFVDVDDVTISDRIGLGAVVCELTKAGNNTVTLEWGPNLEVPEIPVEGCIRAYRTTVTGLSEIYDNCATSASYERTVLIPANGNDYTVNAYLRQGDSEVQCPGQVQFVSTETDGGFFGFAALIAAFFILSALTLIFAGDGELQLVGMGVGLVAVWLLGILPLLFNTIAAILGIIIIVIAIGRYTRK